MLTFNLYLDIVCILSDLKNEICQCIHAHTEIFKSVAGQVDGVRVLTPHCCRHTYISHLVT